MEPGVSHRDPSLDPRSEGPGCSGGSARDFRAVRCTRGAGRASVEMRAEESVLIVQCIVVG